MFPVVRMCRLPGRTLAATVTSSGSHITSVATVRCDRDHEVIEGGEVRTAVCMLDGEWTSQPEQCQGQ